MFNSKSIKIVIKFSVDAIIGRLFRGESVKVKFLSIRVRTNDTVIEKV